MRKLIPPAKSASFAARIEFAHPTGFQGQGTDIEIQAREVIGLKGRLEEIYAFHTEKGREEISRDMERDFFMSPQEAVEYGIIDTVITHREVARSEAAA